MNVEQFRDLLDRRLELETSEDRESVAVSVVNDRGHFLKHRLLNSAASDQLRYNDNPEALVRDLRGTLLDRLDREGSLDLTEEQDLAGPLAQIDRRVAECAAPVVQTLTAGWDDSHTAVAAFRPHPEAGDQWLVFVQRKKASASKHVDGLGTTLIQTQLVSVLVLLGVVGGLWVWLLRFLRTDTAKG